MKASELAQAIGGTLEGEDVELVACGGLEEARHGDLSFCKDVKHIKLVESTQAQRYCCREIGIRERHAR